MIVFYSSLGTNVQPETLRDGPNSAKYWHTIRFQVDGLMPLDLADKTFSSLPIKCHGKTYSRLRVACFWMRKVDNRMVTSKFSSTTDQPPMQHQCFVCIFQATEMRQGLRRFKFVNLDKALKEQGSNRGWLQVCLAFYLYKNASLSS